LLDDISADEKAATAEATVADGFILDFISGTKSLKETPKEQVRQRIARALFHEYGLSVDEMEGDFTVKVGGRKRKIDIAIFHHDKPHLPENISRVVVCKPEPNVGRTSRIRDYEQAESDLEELKSLMEAIESCQYGLWTNGLELFYLDKKTTRFEVKFEPMGDWPMADESLGTRDVVSMVVLQELLPQL
jgi:type I restriction enzyme M protein